MFALSLAQTQRNETMAPTSPHDPAEQGFEQDLKAYFDELREGQKVSPAFRQRLRELPDVAEEAASPDHREGWLMRLWWLPAPISALTLLVALLWQPAAPTLPPTLIAKGVSWRILCAQPRQGKTKGMLAQELKPGQRLRPGALVQFEYRTSQPIYALIVGINQTGQVYPLVQRKDGHSIRLSRGSGVLPRQGGQARAFKLDRYIGQERFLIAYAARAFTYEALRSAIRRVWKRKPSLTSLEQLPGPWQTTSTLFVKAPKPRPKVGQEK